MPRLRIDLAYDGTDFSGWAAQPGRRTVEGDVSAALTAILRAPEPVRLVVAGRTDAGVHARGQVVHADVDPSSYAALPGRSTRSPEAAAVARLNGILPADVVVRRVIPAPEGFDARFSAAYRRYCYRVCDEPATLDPLRRRDTVVVPDPLDVGAMDAAARGLLGLGDFGAFCKKREGATTIRTLLEFSWSRTADGVIEARVVADAFCKKREGATTIRTLLDYSWSRTADGVIEARVVADAFCHSMVRSLVGAVIPVGLRRAPLTFPVEVMRAGIRDPRVKVMPAHGLCLEEVGYPPEAELAGRAQQARSTRVLTVGGATEDR